MGGRENTKPKTPGHLSFERIRTSSALYPLLWLTGAVLTFALPVIIFAAPPFDAFAFILATAAILACIIAFFILLFRDPNRLQSEDYQLDVRRIELLGDDRAPGKTLDLKVTGNTATPQIANSGGAT